jgi:hypothetical protein
MPEHVRDALVANKHVYDAIKRLEQGEAVDVALLRRYVKRVGTTLQRLQHEHEHAKHRARVETDIMHAEMQSEHVDREANAARIAERQRFLFQRNAAIGDASAYDRAVMGANYVETALVTLCPHPATPTAARTNIDACG